MKNVINSRYNRLPIMLWLDDLEDSTMQQAINLANFPFAFHHIAIMPDAHKGYGMPIGGIMATEDVIIPHAIGSDIGCGMCVVKTSLKDMDIDSLKKIMQKIRSCIPLGMTRRKEPVDDKYMPDHIIGSLPDVDSLPIVRQEYKSALHQLGTLGGGNHFIEIQRGSDGYFYFMVHSGSRNLGFQVAKYYNNEAVKINRDYASSVPKEHELAFFPGGSKLYNDYFSEMEYCVEFAYQNRAYMIKKIKECFIDVIKDVQFHTAVNIAHNYARYENHFGKNPVVHRKGATSASKGEIGIIPGNQGSKSYIVKGKGNELSFKSCSHGAGRKMGRKQAEQRLNLEEEQKHLDDQGIIHSIRSEKDLDEASGAYKDIKVVMDNQNDLVDILIELTPLGVIKG